MGVSESPSEVLKVSKRVHSYSFSLSDTSEAGGRRLTGFVSRGLKFWEAEWFTGSRSLLKQQTWR